jgi:hypothetical protein
MSEPQSSSRPSRRFGAAFGTALLTLGELVAVAVAVVMLALPRADRMVRPTAPIYEHCRPTGRASACSPRTCETAPHPMPNRSADHVEFDAGTTMLAAIGIPWGGTND